MTKTELAKLAHGTKVIWKRTGDERPGGGVVFNQRPALYIQWFDGSQTEATDWELAYVHVDSATVP